MGRFYTVSRQVVRHEILAPASISGFFGGPCGTSHGLVINRPDCVHHASVAAESHGVEALREQVRLRASQAESVGKVDIGAGRFELDQINLVDARPDRYGVVGQCFKTDQLEIAKVLDRCLGIFLELRQALGA